MRLVTLVANETTNATSGTTTVLGSTREDYVIQVIGTGTFTVALEGSLDGTNWYSIASKTASEIFKATPAEYLRVVTSGMSGANVTVIAGV